MKTLSKVLSMLIVVVMCMSFFGASASAAGIRVAGGSNTLTVGGGSNTLTVAGSIGDDYASVEQTLPVAQDLPSSKPANSGIMTLNETSGTPVADDSSVKDVATEAELIAALNNADIKTINLTATIIGTTDADINLNGRNVVVNMCNNNLDLGHLTFTNGKLTVNAPGVLLRDATVGADCEYVMPNYGVDVTNPDENTGVGDSGNTDDGSGNVGDGSSNDDMGVDAGENYGIDLAAYFVVENHEFIKGSGKNVIVKLYDMPTLGTDYQYAGLYCVRNYGGASEITGHKLGSSQVDDPMVGVTTAPSSLTIKATYLDTLPSGEYQLFFAVYGKDAVSGEKSEVVYVMENATFTITDDTTIPGDWSETGAVKVHTRYFSEWAQGDDPLQFVIDPHGKNLKIFVDYKEVNVLDWYDYHDGYFYLGTKFLESLGAGVHTLNVQNDWGKAACSFYVHNTLTPKDTTKHVIGSYKDLKYLCSAPIEQVMVGGKTLSNIDGDFYYLSKDGKTLTLTSTFLNNRIAGNTYKLEVITSDGERLPSYFQIITTAQASASPKTGDDSAMSLWIALLLISGVAVATTMPVVKKSKD